MPPRIGVERGAFFFMMRLAPFLKDFLEAFFESLKRFFIRDFPLY